MAFIYEDCSRSLIGPENFTNLKAVGNFCNDQ